MTQDGSSFDERDGGSTPTTRTMIKVIPAPTSGFAVVSILAAVAWSLAWGGMIVSMAVLDSEALFEMLKWLVVVAPPSGMLLGVVGLLRRLGPSGRDARLTACLGIAWNAVGVAIFLLLAIFGHSMSRHGV